jgi:hypothetical protein
MTCFTVAVPTLDPAKRVNYTFGLVLGVDEFRQDQLHHLEKLHRHQRNLHGFGTVWGLKVDITSVGAPPEPEVGVAPGAAVSPSGHDICVPSRMCARLDTWLNSHKADLTARGFGAPPFPLDLCVIVCYRECATDIVPVPGEPCRSETDVMQPSRLADDFELKLCIHDSPITSPPTTGDLCECPVHRVRELGEQEFGRFLRRLVVNGSQGFYPGADQLAAEVRKINDVAALQAGTQPSKGPALFIRPAEVQAMLHAVLNTWLTEVVPALLAADDAASCTGDADRCVLLAQLSFVVTADYRVQGGAAGVTVDETPRPLLLPTRLLQEWVIGGGLRGS